MPKTPLDFSKTQIYKIVCNDLDIKFTYVGHTTNLTKRRYQHKANCNNENRKSYHLKVYETIRQNGGWENWSMVEIEKYPCNDFHEATARERYWYEELNADLNMVRPKRFLEEKVAYNREYSMMFNENNKEKVKQYNEEYKLNNKEKIKEINKIYWEKNKDKIKEKTKKYREENKEKIRAQKKEFYEKNKEKIKNKEKRQR